MKNITLGQYYAVDSPIHRLDPRIKIVLAIFYIVIVFLCSNVLSMALLLISALALVLLSRIPIKIVLKSIKPILFIIAFTAIINIFWTTGANDPLVEWGFITIYKEGLINAVFLIIRITILIIGTSILLTYTTSPISLTDGLEALLSPLKKIGLPVHTFAMMMSIALRFIPTLVEETEKIMNAQKSRGADFTSGSLAQRAKALIPLLVPLFVSSFKRAEELATAMECRCYRGDKNRTKLVKLEYKGLDFGFMCIFAILLGGLICLTVLPYNYPSFGIIYDILFFKV